MSDSINIVILGLLGVGKASLRKQLFHDWQVEEYDNSKRECAKIHLTIDGKSFYISEYGVEEFSPESTEFEYCSLMVSKIRAADGFLLVYDITNHESFDRISGFVEQIKSAREGSHAPFSMILCGNKCDLPADRQVSVEEGLKLAESLECPFIETSAKTAENVENAFHTLARNCVSPAGETTMNDKEGNRKCVIC